MIQNGFLFINSIITHITKITYLYIFICFQHDRIRKSQDEIAKDINLSLQNFQFEDSSENFFKSSEENLREIEKEIHEFYSHFGMRHRPIYLNFSRHPEFLLPWEIPTTRRSNNARRFTTKQTPKSTEDSNQSTVTEKSVPSSFVPSKKSTITEEPTQNNSKNPVQRFSTTEDSNDKFVTESSLPLTRSTVTVITTQTTNENPQFTTVTPTTSEFTTVTPTTPEFTTVSPTTSEFTRVTSTPETSKTSGFRTTKSPSWSTKAPRSRVFDFVL